MNNIVRAWKDATYRQSLSVEEQAILPANPAGEIELADAELEAVFGADDEVNSKVSNKMATTILPVAVGLSAGVMGLQGNPIDCVSSSDASPHG